MRQQGPITTSRRLPPAAGHPEEGNGQAEHKSPERNEHCSSSSFSRISSLSDRRGGAQAEAQEQEVRRLDIVFPLGAIGKV